MDQNESLPACRREIPETSHNIHKLLLCLILRIIRKKFCFDTSDFFAIKSVAYDASLEMAAYFSVTAKLIKSIYNVTLPLTLSFAPFSTKISNLNVQCKKTKHQQMSTCQNCMRVCKPNYQLNFAKSSTLTVSWQSVNSILTKNYGRSIFGNIETLEAYKTVLLHLTKFLCVFFFISKAYWIDLRNKKKSIFLTDWTLFTYSRRNKK